MQSEIGLGCSQESPHKLQPPPQYAVTLDPTLIEQTLLVEYIVFKSRYGQHRTCRMLLDVFNRLTSLLLMILAALWCEIIPEVLRGQQVIRGNQMVEEERDKQVFDEFRRKHSRFFVIVLCGNCEEDEIQEAYERASFITPQGLCLSLNELNLKTTAQRWKLRQLRVAQKYLILFLRFDCFEQLLLLGEISREEVIQVGEGMQGVKKELVEAYQRYDQIEKTFVSSYVEKEHKLLFE